MFGFEGMVQCILHAYNSALLLNVQIVFSSEIIESVGVGIFLALDMQFMTLSKKR